MIGRTERVRDAVLAAVADQYHLDVAERLAAVGASVDRVGDPRRLLDLPRLPVGPVEVPRDDVLQPAERRLPRAGHLLRAPAVLALDRVAAPGTAVGRLRGHG